MSFTLSTGLMASNYAGNTKKSTASGIIFAGWAAGLIAGPRKYEGAGIHDQYLIYALEFFLDSQAPVYDLAFRMLSMSPFSSFAAKISSDICIVNSGLLCIDDHCAAFAVLMVQA